MKAAAGCLASIAWFGLIALFMFGTMMGDCFSEMGHACPTDHERNMSLLEILFGGIGIYLLAAWGIAHFGRRSGTDDQEKHSS